MAEGETVFHSGVTVRLRQVLLTDRAPDLAPVAVDGQSGPPLPRSTDERLQIGDHPAKRE